AGYAVAYEFPWFPFLHNLRYAEEAKKAVAAAILQALPEGSTLGRRWWFAYELFHERLPHPDFPASAAPVPFLPPERFFCTTGRLSPRHGVIDNLWLGDASGPFVEKFAGAEEAVEQFRGELMDVLSPICMMTVKDFLTEAGLRHGVVVEEEKFQRLIQQLSAGGFEMTSAEKEELRWHLGEEALSAARLVTFASWLRGDSPLAFRLREHLLGVEPIDLQWHAPGEVFLDRLSRVISSVETRASQLLEGDLPPNKKQRFFVDAMSKPWTRNDVVVNMDLVKRLQQGLLSVERYEEVLKTQVPNEPRRTTQNWISSEKHDDEYGKDLVLHYLPPPPDMLPDLYEGYFRCVHRMLEDPQMDPIVCATIAKIALNTLHPMADGNGRVQRMIFQLVLFRFNFLPRVNIPVSVVMLQDRTGYEVMQQGHVDQMMAGLRHELVRLKGESEDSFQHVRPHESLGAIYCYQDFTFTVS
ncbi:Fido domain-containing protein, partial [Durusdinium trenchii]